MRRWTLWLPLLALMLLGGMAMYGLSVPKDPFVHSKMVGQKLPAFNMPAAVEGVPPLSSTNFADGTPRLLNIFASWCLPCRAEAPQLDALKKSGVQIYGIALPDKDDGTYRLADFLSEYGNPFDRIGLDGDMRLQLALGSSGVPETYLIGGDGTILYQHIGDIRSEDVGPLLAQLKAAR